MSLSQRGMLFRRANVKVRRPFEVFASKRSAGQFDSNAAQISEGECPFIGALSLGQSKSRNVRLGRHGLAECNLDVDRDGAEVIVQ